MEQFGNPIAPQFSLRQFLLKYLFLVPWLLVTVALSVAYTYTKLRYISPVYVANGKVLIKIDKQAGSAAVAGGDKLGDIVATQVNSRTMDDQIELIRSTALARLVVKETGLQQSYYYKGDVRNTLIHNPSSPIRLQILSIADSAHGFSMEITLFDDRTFMVNRDNKHVKFGDVFQNQLGSFVVMPNSGEFTPQVSFICTWTPESDLARGLAGSIQAATVTKSSNVLNFVYYSENPNVAEDVVNGFLRAYQEYSLNDKRESSASALAFIDNQLTQAKTELNDVESNLQNFKEANKVIGFDQQSGLYYSQMQQANKELQDQGVKVKMMDLLINYVKDPKNAQKSIPLALGFTDPGVSGAVAEFNKMLLQREISLQTIPKDNPIIKDLDRSLVRLRNEVVLSLTQVKDGYKSNLNNMQAAELVANSELRSMPEKTRKMLEITRQQKVAEDFYSSLLQRKIQTSISSASTLSNIQILEPGFSNGAPTSPNPRSMYITAILVALAIPIGIVALLELLNEKVRKRDDIEKITRTPILGEVGHSAEDAVLVVRKNSREFIAEQIRILRSNLQYILTKRDKYTLLVTSGVSGEGKTFISINLGAVHALMGKRTIILEFDIRKPRVMKDLRMVQEGKKRGITNFLMENADLEDVIMKVPDIDNLYVLPCGPVPPNPAELILNDRVKLLFKELQHEFDVLIVDTAPIGLVSDAMELGKKADAAIFVVRHNHTMKAEVNLIDELYKESKLPHMSIVINDARATAAYGKYYGYGLYGYASYGEKHVSSYFELGKRKKTFSDRVREVFGV